MQTIICFFLQDGITSTNRGTQGLTRAPSGQNRFLQNRAIGPDWLLIFERRLFVFKSFCCYNDANVIRLSKACGKGDVPNQYVGDCADLILQLEIQDVGCVT